jgi:hypothetical protein
LRQGGRDLPDNDSFSQLNPATGFACEVTPRLAAYAGYAEANRTPTPAWSRRQADGSPMSNIRILMRRTRAAASNRQATIRRQMLERDDS